MVQNSGVFKSRKIFFFFCISLQNFFVWVEINEEIFSRYDKQHIFVERKFNLIVCSRVKFPSRLDCTSVVVDRATVSISLQNKYPIFFSSYYQPALRPNSCFRFHFFFQHLFYVVNTTLIYFFYQQITFSFYFLVRSLIVS